MTSKPLSAANRQIRGAKWQPFGVANHVSNAQFSPKSICPSKIARYTQPLSKIQPNQYIPEKIRPRP